MHYVDRVSLMGQIALSSIHNHLQTLGGCLILVRLNPSVEDEFDKTNLSETLHILDDEIEAIKAVEQLKKSTPKDSTETSSFYIKELNSFVGWDAYPVVDMIQ